MSEFHLVVYCNTQGVSSTQAMNVSEFHLVVIGGNTQGVSSTQAMNVSDLLQGAQVQSALIFSPRQLPPSVRFEPA